MKALSATGQFDVTAPTGKDQDVNKIVDVASGDDQTDLGVGLFVDYFVTPEFTLSGTLGYTSQLADKNPERIPEVSYSKQLQILTIALKETWVIWQMFKSQECGVTKDLILARVTLIKQRVRMSIVGTSFLKKDMIGYLKTQNRKWNPFN